MTSSSVNPPEGAAHNRAPEATEAHGSESHGAAGHDSAPLEAAAREITARHGLVLESLRMTRRPEGLTADLVVDLPEDEIGAADLDTVSEVSRELSALIDADDSLLGPGPSVLEVGTPGAERRLTALRHWKRARTRLVRARWEDGTEYRVRVREVSDDGILRLVPERDVDNRGRRIALPKGTPDVWDVPWTDIASAQVLLEFTAPDPRAKEH